MLYEVITYSCSTYPDCDYAVWNEPIAEPCPSCGWPVLRPRENWYRYAGALLAVV